MERGERLGFRYFSTIRGQGGYDFPRAAVAKCHELRTTEMFSLTVVGARSPKSKWQQGPLKAPRSMLPGLWQPLVAPGLWQHDSSLCLCPHVAAACVSVSSSQQDSSHWI